MKITMEVHGLTEVQKALTERFSPRRLNAVMATALTRTAQDVREAVRQELPRVFDRPTPYTLNSLFVRPATAQRLQCHHRPVVLRRRPAGQRGLRRR